MSGAASSPLGKIAGAFHRTFVVGLFMALCLVGRQHAVAASSITWTNLTILGDTSDATFIFTPTPTPGTSSGGIATGAAVAVPTTNGIGSIPSILGGRYTVRVPNRSAFIIWVPTSGSYALQQLYKDANGGTVAADAPFLPTTGGDLSGNLRFSGVLSGGVIPPHLTTAQRDALNVVSNGMAIFNTTLNTNQVRGPGGWFDFPGGTDASVFAQLSVVTGIVDTASAATLQSATNYTDGLVALYALISDLTTTSNSLKADISAGVDLAAVTNAARAVIGETNPVTQAQLVAATNGVVSLIPDTSSLATKTALAATNNQILATVDLLISPFISAATATNIAAYQAGIVSNGVMLQIPSVASFATTTALTTTSNGLLSQIESATGITAGTATNIGASLITQSNLAPVELVTTTSNALNGFIGTASNAVVALIPSVASFATTTALTTTSNSLLAEIQSGFGVSASVATNIAAYQAGIVSNGIVLLIPSTNGFITMTPVTVSSNALQTQIDSLMSGGISATTGTNIVNGQIILSNLVNAATLSTATQTVYSAIKQTNGFVGSQITNGLASIYLVQAVSNWVPTQIQSTNGFAGTNWVALYNYNAMTNGVLPRWTATTLTADAAAGFKALGGSGPVTLVGNTVTIGGSSTFTNGANFMSWLKTTALTNSGVMTNSGDIFVGGSLFADGADFRGAVAFTDTITGHAGPTLTDINWPGPGLTNLVVAGDATLTTNSGAVVITVTAPSPTNGVTAANVTNIVSGMVGPSGSNFVTITVTNGLTGKDLVDQRTTALTNYVDDSIAAIGSASLGDITNTVTALSVLSSGGAGTNTTLVNPTVTGLDGAALEGQEMLIIIGDSMSDAANTVAGPINYISRLREMTAVSNKVFILNGSVSGTTLQAQDSAFTSRWSWLTNYPHVPKRLAIVLGRNDNASGRTLSQQTNNAISIATNAFSLLGITNIYITKYTGSNGLDLTIKSDYGTFADAGAAAGSFSGVWDFTVADNDLGDGTHPTSLGQWKFATNIITGSLTNLTPSIENRPGFSLSGNVTIQSLTPGDTVLTLLGMLVGDNGANKSFSFKNGRTEYFYGSPNGVAVETPLYVIGAANDIKLGTNTTAGAFSSRGNIGLINGQLYVQSIGNPLGLYSSSVQSMRLSGNNVYLTNAASALFVGETNSFFASPSGIGLNTFTYSLYGNPVIWATDGGGTERGRAQVVGNVMTISGSQGIDLTSTGTSTATVSLRGSVFSANGSNFVSSSGSTLSLPPFRAGTNGGYIVQNAINEALLFVSANSDGATAQFASTNSAKVTFRSGNTSGTTNLTYGANGIEALTVSTGSMASVSGEIMGYNGLGYVGAARNASGLTNYQLRAANFTFTNLANVSSQPTNHVIDLAGAPYQRMLMTNTVFINHLTNGPGAVACTFLATNANQTLAWPVAFIPQSPTNGLTKGASFWSVTVTNGQTLTVAFTRFIASDPTTTTFTWGTSP